MAAWYRHCSWRYMVSLLVSLFLRNHVSWCLSLRLWENERWKAKISYAAYYDQLWVTSFCLPFSEPSLVGLALTQLTNHRPSVLWCCRLGHLTRKIVPEMTYNVWSVMLNPAVPYRTMNCAVDDEHVVVWFCCLLLVMLFSVISWVCKVEVSKVMLMRLTYLCPLVLLGLQLELWVKVGLNFHRGARYSCYRFEVKRWNGEFCSLGSVFTDVNWTEDGDLDLSSDRSGHVHEWKWWWW